jgi:predicted O-linked N-acetylglucosamine transferase (SPINDLY family)
LGLILHQRGEHQLALESIQQAVDLAPDSPTVHCNLGVAYQALNRMDEAIACYRRAIALKPVLAIAHSNLGLALNAIGQFDQAAGVLRNALDLDPSDVGAYNALGLALDQCGQLDQAIACFQKALARDPRHLPALINLGNSYKDQGLLDKSLGCYQQALTIDPDCVAAAQCFLCTIHFHPGYDARTIYRQHQAFQARHEEPLRRFVKPHTNDRTVSRRLRIGYVSGDFRDHPVGRFILPLLASHDRERFQIHLYSSMRYRPDEITNTIRAHAARWTDIAPFSDEQAAQLVRDDQIDILVDLTMHMAENRLLLFARRPAPIQVTYLAYCSTTGLKGIDYRFTDPYLDPSLQTQEIYSEKSIHLNSYWCYHPQGEIARIAPPAALTNGRITFGCLNNFSKVSEPALLTWCDVLRSVPNSCILIHAAPGSHRQRVLDLFLQHEIPPTRLRFAPHVPRSEYFSLYNQLDIALDPFPYGGGSTSCDALWMGVPLITLRGQTAVGRGGSSILSQIGLPELIANSRTEYVQIAASLAADLDKLSKLRLTMRQRMQHSPLMNATSFATNVELAYRAMWHRWCERGE